MWMSKNAVERGLQYKVCCGDCNAVREQDTYESGCSKKNNTNLGYVNVGLLRLQII